MKRLITAISLALMTSFNCAYALPTGENVRSGSAEIVRNADSVIINQNTNRVAIDWSSFSIARNELVKFNQNGGIALNRVTGTDPSSLFGRLQSDGTVYLINPNGIIFGKDFVLDTGSFYASTKMVDDDIMTNFANTNIDSIISFEPDENGNIINTDGIIKADKIQMGENGEIQLVSSGNIIATGDIKSSNLGIAGKNITLESGSLTNTGNLSLSAMRDLTIKNTPIIITAGDAKLASDTDKDFKGMISIIGSDITVDGNLTFNSPTTGTYFEFPSGEGNIDVGEHAVTFNGGVAVNNSTLNIKTKDIVFGGNVDSANSYKLLINESRKGADVKDDSHMKSLAEAYYQIMLKGVVYKSFDELTTEEYEAIKARCLDEYRGYHNRTLPTNETEERTAVETYFNTHVKIPTLAHETEFSDLSNEEYNLLAKHILTTYNYADTDNRESILNNWNNAIIAAKEGTNGGSSIGDKYLTTITDAIENWRITSLLEGKDYELLLGGKTDIVGKTVKADREFRWYTGIEGDKGNTKFFTTTGVGEGITHTYSAWSKDPDGIAHYEFNEPNNNGPYDQPYVAIGWHDNSGNGWADVDNLKNTVRGFVQEINNPRSTINVTLTGNATEQGKIGDSVPITINYIRPAQPEQNNIPINEAKNIIVDEYNKTHLFKTGLDKNMFLEDGILLDKEESGKVTNYGLYNVYVNKNKVTLLYASALTLPQKPTIEYENKEYSNEDFKYVCNGTNLDIYALSESAKDRVKNENKFNNEKVALEALQIAYNKMNIDVIKLCEICVHF